ncbi:DDB1- and CUL4-associated factor 10 homolog [Euwallacea fornicatus]|uniref:DDB1- and CUL4-associated factor 10 homolog n=1 Tax=Euwallacea fornicatus TaxID=995702 RepID=UPI00338F1756
MSSFSPELLLSALKKKSSELPQYAHVPDIITRRSLGLKTPLGSTDTLISSIYNSFDVRQSCRSSTFDQYQGGIFNLEFNLDGRLLAAACEAKQVLLHDSGNQKRIKTIENAHLKCVNCIKFLNEKTFATGSDDTLIKLWDIRNLNNCLKTLHGHRSWVKNIEWSEQDQVMVTSAFDGTIYSWNLKENSENGMLFDKVFLMKGLMRMKLTPDSKKMIISTTSGYMIIIHDLNLLNLATDLRSFRPGLYRLMQKSHQAFPVVVSYNYLFSQKQKRNRIEFIDDFPNEAECISSLQIHPYGWCAVSRNINREIDEEWTAVHDIQERDAKEYEEAYEYVEECDISEENETSDDEELPNSRPTDLWMGNITLEEYMNDSTEWRPHQAEMAITNSGLIGMKASNEAYFKQHQHERNKLVKNLSRLTHYIKEKNVAKGFIKVLSFSPDGRVICSPYETGIRLLAFSRNCQELSECVPESARPLETILETNNYHRDVVVSCKFNPMHFQLVTGCLGSEIKWHQPVL